jgi:hypothetical protein
MSTVLRRRSPSAPGRSTSASERCRFVPQALVMPVTYGLLTPLALFTLDSASWETRGHDAR